jgi:hypothetical protein
MFSKRELDLGKIKKICVNNSRNFINKMDKQVKKFLEEMTG